MFFFQNAIPAKSDTLPLQILNYMQAWSANFLCTMSNREKNCLVFEILCMCMWSLFIGNAIATLPSQNDKLQANVIKFLIYYTGVYSKRTQAKKIILTFTWFSGTLYIIKICYEKAIECKFSCAIKLLNLVFY